MSRRAAPLALAGATVAVSISAVLIQEARTDAATVVWLRMALAVMLLAPWAVRGLRNTAGPTRSELALTVVAGLLLAVHFLTWTASLAFTSVAASVLLVSLHPVVVAPLGARLHGDAVSRRLIAGMGLALGGTVVTCAGALGPSSHALEGDLLAITGGVALAGYLLIGRSRRRDSSVVAYSATAYAIVSFAAVVTAAAAGGVHAPSGRALLACLGLAAVCTVGGHTVFNWTLRRLPASSVSLAFLGEPPLAALFAFLVLGQRPSPSTLAGGVLILAGLATTLTGAGPDAQLQLE